MTIFSFTAPVSAGIVLLNGATSIVLQLTNGVSLGGNSGGGVSLGETASTAYRGDRGKLAYDHSLISGNPHGTTTANVTDSLNKRYQTDTQQTNNDATSSIQTQLNSKQVLLGFTPYNATNPAGYLTSITSGDVTTALGFTPESLVTAGTISQYYRGDKTWQSFPEIPSIVGLATTAYVDTQDGFKVDKVAGSRLITSTESTLLGNTSGVNTGDKTLAELGGVASNIAITGGTSTKVTYDAKGLVTAGSSATTADIADSFDKRYVLDSEKTKLNNLSGTNTGDQDLSGLAHKGANTDITSITALTGAIELNGKYRIAYNAGTNSLDITYIG